MHPMSTTEDSLKPKPDEAAAHQFLTELRTRISTQPLPYQYGVEARALGSMWEVFGHARDAIKENPGCEKFAGRTTEVLNLVVRPLTAKWHRAFEEGRLNGRDGADSFRGEFRGVQEKLRKFASELHEMAYGKPHEDALTPDVMEKPDLDALFEPLAFGFTAHSDALKEVAETIRTDEAEAVRARRKAWLSGSGNPPRPAAGQDAIGLALSGGGIRSATFSLGVVQVLAENGFLKEVDFLSTVSGGGYTGCFLTQRLGGGEAHSGVAAPHGPDPEPVRYVRQHAKFLSPYNLKEKWSMVAATLAGMLLNLCVPLCIIVALAFVATFAGDYFAKVRPAILGVSSILCGIAMIAYGIGMRMDRKTSLATGGIFAALLAFTAALAAGGVLESLFRELPGRLLTGAGMPGGIGLSIAAVSAAIAAAAPAIIRFLPVLKNPKVRKVVLQVLLKLVGLLMPLVAVLLFYTFWHLGRADGGLIGQAGLAGIAVGLALVSVLVLNINLTSPHRLYRDGLARTFIQKTGDGTPDVKLAGVNAEGTAPCHIINAALNVPSSKSAALKDRGCDFFMFSKEWMGSPSTGYVRTQYWKANGSDVDLATAMAVSGAAFSSHMGLGSMPALTALLTVLNVRLGFWIRKPGDGWGSQAPGFGCLLRETLSVGMSGDEDWLNLSDGGHVENMAVYELLRRRCKFIICVDGESDPTFTFHGLMTLVRHAQIDFGIRITPRLDDIRPDPGTGYGRCHFHLCRIHYPEGIGLLLYIKLSVTGNEPELIRRYRTNNPEFPHQTTLDQFFDQEQFEAYRQLGVHAAEGLFLPALLDGPKPASVPAWFRQLARNLLEPIKAS
jgi:hypothetical protein